MKVIGWVLTLCRNGLHWLNNKMCKIEKKRRVDRFCIENFKSEVLRVYSSGISWRFTAQRLSFF